MKAFTNFEQSKKLAEILPLESADMVLLQEKPYEVLLVSFNEYNKSWRQKNKNISYLPCWSLTSLLGVLKERNDCNTLEMFTNKAQLYTITTSYYKDASWKNMSTVSDNPVDACVEMIIKLKENSLI